ncbi:hypothetical protein GTC6_11876 [Gordonia terrae C-6]|uniref:N-acetyltransferase domain-containing protein n=1 Tax=Gordonia terrae C-6 TaxID=1316928 RepID=R7Y9N7_9ACTN|nr:hypothetical protein [Gordonia terrae]EON32494.1 hypothetical protein GTC6_11876 [Gordonia terrae C-6]
MVSIHATGIRSRPLTAADRPLALNLLAAGMQEVPVYRWLLGDDAPAEAFRWYGDILFTDHLPGTRGMFTPAGEMTALLAVAGPDHRTQPVDDELAARSRHFVIALDGFITRFRELQQKSRARSVDGAHSIVFALVHPDHRRHGTLGALLDPVLQQALDAGSPVTASTADEHMIEVYARRWGGRVYDEFTLTDGPTVWFLKVDPPETV